MFWYVTLRVSTPDPHYVYMQEQRKQQKLELTKHKEQCKGVKGGNKTKKGGDKGGKKAGDKRGGGKTKGGDNGGKTKKGGDKGRKTKKGTKGAKGGNCVFLVCLILYFSSYV